MILLEGLLEDFEILSVLSNQRSLKIAYLNYKGSCGIACLNCWNNSALEYSITSIAKKNYKIIEVTERFV
jgi:hypothetical protein